MRADQETYEKVAQNCSEYAPKNGTSQDTTFKSMYSEGPTVSCTTCQHFDEEKYCKLNLFDPIKNNHNN